MKKEQKKDKQYGSVYEFEGRVPLKRALPLGIQHVLAMFLANISPLMIVCGLLDIALDLRTSLIQNAMFVAAIATLLQLYPVWKLGSRLPIVMGTSSSFISTAGVIGASAGYGAIVGACIVGSVMELILGYFIKPLRKLFPPLVTSLVIMAIGLTLLPVGISFFTFQAMSYLIDVYRGTARASAISAEEAARRISVVRTICWSARSSSSSS